CEIVIQSHANEYFPPFKHSTFLNHIVIYQYITKLTFINKIIETYHYFTNVNTLELGNKSPTINLIALSTIVDLNRVKTSSLSSSIEHQNIKFLLNNMPRLENLSISSQQRLSKATTEQTDFASYLRSTPILNRLQVRPDDHTAAVSSSSSTSPQPGLIAAKSKNK
ncbi:unnamed protein product, partial [Rotaria sp. Silwood2]